MSDKDSNAGTEEQLLHNLIRDIAASDHIDSQALAEYVDGTIDGTAQQLVGAHLENCAECRHRVELMRQRRTAAEGEAEVRYSYERPEPAQRAAIPPFHRLAAAAVGATCLAAIGVVGFLLIGRHGTGPGAALVALDVSYAASAEHDLPGVLGAEGILSGNRGIDGAGLRVLRPRNGEKLLDERVAFRLAKPAPTLIHVDVASVSGDWKAGGEIRPGETACTLRVPRGADYYWHLEGDGGSGSSTAYLSFHVASSSEAANLQAESSVSRRRGPFHHAAFLWTQRLYAAWEVRTKLNLQIPGAGAGPHVAARIAQLRRNLAAWQQGDAAE